MGGTVRTRRAHGRPLRAALCTAGLWWLQSVVPCAAQTLVSGVFGLALSPAPGDAPARVVQGGVALKLSQTTVNGLVWQHLLASDGQHGWNPQALSSELPVEGRAAPGTTLELMPVPPGHGEFLSSLALPVPEGATGALLGGSPTSLVADTASLALPPWLNPDLAPWTEWSLGGVQGWAPLAAMRLSWPLALPQAATGAAAWLDAAQLKGLTRAPFLAPVARQLQALAPPEGALALDLSGAPATTPGRQPLSGPWDGPVASYRPQATARQGLASLVVLAQGRARAFVWQRPAGEPAVALADDDDLALSRVTLADLDGDGLPDWALEVVGLYGDGYYSELWVVDGRSARGPLRVWRQALSRSAGEAPEKAQDAAWSLGADGTLWLWRAQGQGTRLQAWRLGRQGLTLQRTVAPAWVVLGEDLSHTAAQQRQLQALANHGATDTLVVPQPGPQGLRWQTVVPMRHRAAALQWAKAQGLQAAAVRGGSAGAR
jgi:hypothetical protein